MPRNLSEPIIGELYKWESHIQQTSLCLHIVWTNRRSCIVPAALSYKTSLDLVDGWTRRGLLRDCENRLWNRWSTTQHYVLCGAVKGLCLLQHLSGVLGKLQPGPRQETLPSAECKHALFNGDPASAALFAQLCNSAILGRLQGDQQQNEWLWAVMVMGDECHLEDSKRLI